jgi:hypothetical protein
VANVVIDFDHDLDEMVNSGQRDVSLRTAVVEYIQARRTSAGASIASLFWTRHNGKGHFETEHIEALSRLPEFAGAPKTRINQFVSHPATPTRVALTLVPKGLNLPVDGAPWRYISSVDLARGERPLTTTPTEEILGAIEANGYFIWPVEPV